MKNIKTQHIQIIPCNLPARKTHLTLSLLSFLLLNLAVSFHPKSAFAQKENQGKTKYKLLSGINGEVIFDYRITRSDSLKTGNFKFVSIPEDLGNSEFRNVKFDGEFKNNLKNGKWNFNYQKLKLRDTIIAKNYQFAYPANGVEVIVKASFEEGIASGNWDLSKYEINNSTVKDTLLRATRTYRKGTPVEKITGKNYHISFEGEFDKDGIMNNLWKFEVSGEEDSKKTIFTEYRKFETGFLIEHYFVYGNDTIKAHYVGQPQARDDEGEWVELPFEEAYFEVIDFTQIGFSGRDTAPFDIKTQITNSNAILLETLQSFYRLNGSNIWMEIPGSENPQKGNVSVKKYPFSSQENGFLNNFRQIVDTINKLFNSYFRNPQIEINKIAFEDIGQQYAIMTNYQKSFITIEEILDSYSHDAFLYIDRDAILPHLLTSYVYPDSITFTLDDKEIREAYDFIDLENKEDVNLEALVSHLKLIQTDLLQIEEKSNEALGEYKKKGLLQEMEEQAINLRDSIEILFSGNELNTYQKRVADQVNSNVRKVFNEYAKLNSDVKIDTIAEVISCMETFINFHKFLNDLPAELKYVDESYTRTVWNPFTFTEMDERMKERVYSVYEDVFLPSLLGELNKPTDCRLADGWMKDMQTVLDRMLFLINQDTKLMERQLRRENKLESILEIFELSQIQIN